MKKLFIHTLFLFIFTFVFTSIALADVIPPDTHPVDGCAKVVNLDEFPNVALIGYYTGPMIDNYETYKIENNQCLTKDYKLNTLSIYWNTKDKANIIDPNKILLKNVSSLGGYIDNDNPLIKENVEYSIAGFDDDQLVIYKSKHISEYNDGTPIKVQTFDNPLESDNLIVDSSSKSTEKNFWQKIVCFFKRLFGGSCS